MAFDRTPLMPEHGCAILEGWLGARVSPPKVQRLSGGMINSVLLLRFDVQPGEAVVKISPDMGKFGHEAKVLRWLRENTDFPVPEVYAHEAEGSTVPLSFLLMESLPGVNLGEAGLSNRDREDMDRQMARVLLDLHSHQSPAYGDLFGDQRRERWVDVFRPRMQTMFEEAEGKVPARTHTQVDRILDALDDLFDHQGEPTVVHGDIWVTNVMVAPSDKAWRLTGFVDPGAQFADVEHELAYLEVFNTVTAEFFRQYCRVRPLRDGYERRRLIYWLQTMLIHVNIFGDAHYVANTERLADTICREWLDAR